MASPITVDIEGRYNDRDINRAMADLRKLQAQGVSVGDKMQAVGGKMQAFGTSVAKVGKSMTVGVTLPIVGVGVAATKMAIDFDESMTKMVSLVGLTRDEVDGMRGDIIAMASQYGKSANEAADAMFFITSAGLRGADAMEALESSLKGAAVGLGDTKTIADLATSAVNAYGPATLGASKATDILAAAVREGKLESSELAGAMGGVLPVASAMGVNFDEVGAAMAAMSRTGTNASQASTQLRGILNSLLKPSKQAEKALGGMGLSSEGLRKQLREEGLLATLQTLSEKFDGNDAAAAKVFGNVRALSGVMDLMGANAETTAEIFGNMTDTTGLMDDAFAAASETTGFQLQQAFATLKNSMIEIGDVIAPFVEQFAERLAALGQAFQNLSPEIKNKIVMFAGIAAAIGPVLIIVGKVISIIGGLIKAIGLVIAVFNPVTAVIAAVVAVIALLVAAFTLAWRNSQPLRDAVKTLWNTFKSLVDMIRTQVIETFNRMSGTTKSVSGIFETLGRYLGGVFTVVVNTVTGVVKVLGGVFQVALKAFEVGITVFKMVANVIKGAVLAAIDILMNKLGPISRLFRMAADNVKTTFSAIAGFVSKAFNNVGTYVEKFINFVIKAINVVIGAYNKLAGLLPGMSRISEIAEFRFQKLSGAAEEVAYKTYEATQNMDAFQREAFAQANATNVVAEATNDLNINLDDLNLNLDQNTDRTGKNTKQNEKATKALDKYKETFEKVAASLKAKAKEIEDAYKGVIKSVQDVVMGAFDTSDIDPNRIGENGEKVGGTWLDGLASQAAKAVEFANKVAQVVKLGLEPGSAAFDMVMQVTKQQGEGLLDELIAGGVDAVQRSKDIVNSVITTANQIGTDAAEQFYGTGLRLAQQTEAAFNKRFGKGGPGYGKLNQLMNHLAKSMERTTTITVVTRHVPEGVPGRRMGGPVAAGQPYIVGESGMELFVPQRDGVVIPNHDLRGSMTGRGGAITGGGAGTTINLTVNAGMGTQGAEVGRQIVDALKQYERRNGPVYVAA